MEEKGKRKGRAGVPLLAFLLVMEFPKEERVLLATKFLFIAIERSRSRERDRD